MSRPRLLLVAFAGMLAAGTANAADTQYDGTWTGTYSPLSTQSPKCNTDVTKRTVTVKDGVGSMTTRAKDGHLRSYAGTVQGDTLTLTSDDMKVTYSGKFDGNKYRATTGSLNCTYSLDLEKSLN